MQRIRPIEGIARTANNFDAFCQFCRQLKQLIDITEAIGPGWHPVLERQECATGPGTNQNRRTYGWQVLLTASPGDPDTGNPRKKLIRMRLGRLLHRLATQ